MTACVDIGNSTIAFGFFSDSGVLVHFFKLSDCDILDFRKLLSAKTESLGIIPAEVSAVYISSVVPKLVPGVSSAVSSLFSCRIVNVHVGCSSVMEKGISQQLGCDIYANLVAARYKYPNDNIVMVDFGTATTISFCDCKGHLAGVSITLGVMGTLKTLCNATAQIPDFSSNGKFDIIPGMTTLDSVSSGVVLATVGMLEKSLQVCREHFFVDFKVIATGGFSKVVGRYTDVIDEVDEYNTVKGILYCGNEIKGTSKNSLS